MDFHVAESRIASHPPLILCITTFYCAILEDRMWSDWLDLCVYVECLRCGACHFTDHNLLLGETW